MIRVRLEQFDFPLCASKPGCELSKAASKAAVENSERGGSKPASSGALQAERGWWTGGGCGFFLEKNHRNAGSNGD